MEGPHGNCLLAHAIQVVEATHGVSKLGINIDEKLFPRVQRRWVDLHHDVIFRRNAVDPSDRCISDGHRRQSKDHRSGTRDDMTRSF